MSRENLDTVGRVLDAFRELDYDRAAAEFAEDAEWHNTASFPGQSVCCGPDEIKAFWEGLSDVFALGHNAVVAQIVEHEDLVVTETHSRGRGKASGAPVEARWGTLFQLRAGKIVRVQIFGDYRNALRAAGLRE
jgi:ketosteroid isomerase-like protein